MRSIAHTPKHAPVITNRRMPSFKAYLKAGGAAGMVRRIILNWNFPFTVNQLKVAFHHRHPEIHLGDFQIDDILEYMAARRQLVRLADGSYQRPQSIQEAA